MGVGWEYFNNICQAVRVALGLAAGIVGLIVVFLVGGSLMEYWHSRTPDATLIVPPTAASATSPAATPNPQFKASAVPGATAPGGTTTPAAATLQSKPNPQFQQPQPSAPAGAGTNPVAAPPASTLKPNPQFSPNPQFH